MRTPVSDPQKVGPYQIIGRLGSGGMGWVYLGRSPTGRKVAVKVVRPEFCEEPEFRDRFAREVSAARSVDGLFTAAVVDADTDGDPPWLATVYVPGPSLSEEVARNGPLPEAQVRLLGAGLAEALRAIHGAGVVHRDLKPSNVLLAPDGPRVIDFGISRIVGESGLTRSGVVLGTPAFMSPEQITGMMVGPSSDIFSLGGILFFAATGKWPFGGGDGHLYRLVHGEAALETAPAALRGLIGRCLAKAPADRPDLDTLLGDLLADAQPVLGPLVTAEQALNLGGWPFPAVAETIQAHGEAPPEGHGGTAGASASCLTLHAQALLDAGLTDALVMEAVRRAGR
ncbi:serine/threonine-protein kinase [Yinghuangia soli]|uniref:Serine/threonine protein kinase n=1 Tax=Yinghuangia soli TaxID=2908204 RepID=A0AA41Q8F0_9ACTN|nr:serine/threonine-protein kinase [Yinghuangia soli]MCF2532641.1 serine/threonine protein kinase [Yinghuangia soli]